DSGSSPMLLVNGSLLMTPLFPRSGPGESSSPTSQVILRCYDFPARIPGRLFVSPPGSTLPSSFRVSQLALALLEGQRVPSRPGHCSAGDPIAGLLSRGRERDLPGFQAVHPVPLPRSRTPAESTIPRLFVGLIDAAPASRTAKASACQLFRGSITRLQHLLPTLHEWCCHHPCKARFRLASSPLPGGSRTLWIAMKGFRLHFRPPLLDFSWRNEGFRHFVTSMAAPVASGWSVAGWGLHPLESAALSRRTPDPDS